MYSWLRLCVKPACSTSSLCGADPMGIPWSGGWWCLTLHLCSQSRAVIKRSPKGPVLSALQHLTWPSSSGCRGPRGSGGRGSLLQPLAAPDQAVLHYSRCCTSWSPYSFECSPQDWQRAGRSLISWCVAGASYCCFLVFRGMSWIKSGLVMSAKFSSVQSMLGPDIFLLWKTL